VEKGEPVYVSVETIYLVERGRLPLEALHRLEAGLKHIASGLLVQAVDEDVAQAVHKVPRDVVPDMPDRIIAATAVHLGLPLITGDERIRSAGIKTIW